MILYEYPFNERIRAYLRLERLLERLGELMRRDTALDHHYALTTLFEILDVAARADLKSDLLKDIDRQRAVLQGYRGNPAISESSLDAILSRLDQCFSALNQQHGKPGYELSDNEWLMSVRSRSVIPGGTCEFDLPAYHAWQHQPASERRADIERWAATLEPMAQATLLLLQILRDSGKPQKVVATAGVHQQTLPPGRSFQLLRLRIDGALGLIPEISGNRLMVSVRLVRHEPDGKLHAVRDDAAFELALCA